MRDVIERVKTHASFSGSNGLANEPSPDFRQDCIKGCLGFNEDSLSDVTVTGQNMPCTLHCGGFFPEWSNNEVLHPAPLYAHKVGEHIRIDSGNPYAVTRCNVEQGVEQVALV